MDLRKLLNKAISDLTRFAYYKNDKLISCDGWKQEVLCISEVFLKGQSRRNRSTGMALKECLLDIEDDIGFSIDKFKEHFNSWFED